VPPVTVAQVPAKAETGVGNLAEGEKLFKTTCTACHQISDQTLVGPGLKNVDKRRSANWIVKFVKNSQALIKSGDKQAVEVFNKFNQVPMPNHDYSDAQILSILAYIKSESAK